MVDSDSFSRTLDQTSGLDDGKQEEDFCRYKYSADDDDDDEFFRVSIRKELASPSALMDGGDWIVSARLDCIKWIFSATTLMRFQLSTAYLSVAYFDKFLSRRMIDNEKYWAVRLLSVACLSLAAKMEECKVPLLKDFPMEDYCFEGKVIQRMEILVLNTLEWEMNLVTPFHYIHYFISKFWDGCPPRNVVPMDLIYAIIKDVKLMSSRSSVIAAAATLLTLDEKLSRQGIETKIKTFACGVVETIEFEAPPDGFVMQQEDVFRCYIRMQELSQDKINLTPVQCTGANVYESSSVASVVNTKRKRLEFDDRDQDNVMPTEKRQP